MIVGSIRWPNEGVLGGARGDGGAVAVFERCDGNLVDEAPKLARQLGLSADVQRMAQDKRVREVIRAVIDDANRRFARVEQVKRFAILDHDLTEAAGELTPTLKVKRAAVYERYADVFKALYEDEATQG